VGTLKPHSPIPNCDDQNPPSVHEAAGLTGSFKPAVCGSDFRAFEQRDCIVHVDAEVADSVRDVCVAQQDLDCSKIAGRFVDQGSFRTSQRMGTIIASIEANHRNPLIDQASVLPGAEMAKVIDPARKHEIV